MWEAPSHRLELVLTIRVYLTDTERVRGICRERYYTHFWEEGHRGLDDVVVQMIGYTDVREPTRTETF